MNVMSYSDARASLRQTIDKVCEDHTPTVITSQKSDAVVMISLADYNSMQETLHLVSSPANARRLHQSIAQLRAGGAKPRGLLINEQEEAEQG